MKSIMIALIFLFVSVPFCCAESECSISSESFNKIYELKQYMDSYVQNAFGETQQFGSDRKDYLVQALNNMIIISENLDLLLSILDVNYSRAQEEFPDDLTPQELVKYIDFIIERMGMMLIKLDKQLQSTHDALMIHHVESVKRFFNEVKRVLWQAKHELRLQYKKRDRN